MSMGPMVSRRDLNVNTSILSQKQHVTPADLDGLSQFFTKAQ